MLITNQCSVSGKVKRPRTIPDALRPVARHRGLSIESLEPRQLLAANPIINEFLARNDGGLRDGDGRTSDWIEIFNAGDMAADLTGYRLTDTADNRSLWAFPSVMLEPGDYLVVFASGQETADYVDPQGNLHTNFSLQRGGDYLALVDPAGTLVSEFSAGGENFLEQLINTSFGGAQSLSLIDSTSQATYLIPLDDSLALTWTEPTLDAAAAGFLPGTASLGLETEPNNRTNFVGQFDTVLPDTAHAVFVRMEFNLNVASAISNLSMRTKYDNGFVAYINGVKVAEENAPANPSWFATALSGSRRDNEALQLVEYDLSDHVGALVDGKNILAIHGLNHPTDDSDMLLVTELSAGVSDMLAATGQPAKVGYMPTPTPGGPNGSNNEVFAGFVADTKFSVNRGYFDAPFQVEITTETPGAEIRYTTDGSAPSPTHGAVYPGPITISATTPLRAAAFKDGFLPTNADTQTYIFLDGVIKQDGAGLPETWGTFPFGSTEAPVRDPVPANYEMDPDVVNDPRYSGTIKDDLRTLPTVSVVLDPDDLWDPERGIYSNPVEQGIDWERPVSVELINVDGATTEFQIDAGVRIHGGFGRRPAACAKHSFRLLFRGEYGATKLEYPWFGEDQVDSFDTIVLRGNYNYSWCRGDRTGTQTGKDYTMVTDAWGSVSQQEMGGLAPNSAFVHLYLNGLYWGVYVPTERPNASFQAEHRGGDKQEYDVMGHDGLVDGDQEAWNHLTRDVLRQNPVDYGAVQDLVDMDNYIDYMILNQFGGNGDWPQNNWFASRRRVDGEKWQFHSWDTEFFFINLNENRIRGIPAQGPGLILNELRDVDEFRLQFADRIHRQLFNDGVLTPEANIARLNTLVEPLDRAVVGESARWGDAWMDQVSPPRTRDDDWIPKLEDLRNVYFPQRNNIVIEQYRDLGLYPETDAPEFNQHGGPVPSGFGLAISNPNAAGTVYYTIDGTDPRSSDGSATPTAMAYDGTPVALTGQQLVKARVLDDVQWSALTEAEFSIASDFPLGITEISFNPHDANPVPGLNETNGANDRFEFIELMNVGSEPLNLEGVQLVESAVRSQEQGVVFNFAPQSLQPAERIVVVGDRAAFQSRYGDSVRIAGGSAGEGLNDGAYDLPLSDFGERLTLVDSSGTIIQQFTYGVRDPWPARTSGLGSSLEIIDPTGSPGDPNNWRASSLFGGTPGVIGQGVEGQIVINEVLSNPAAQQSVAVELYNPTGQDVSITNWYVSNSAEDFFKARITTDASVPAGGYHVLSELGLGLDGARGDEIWLLAADANGKPLGFVDRVQFGNSLSGVSLGPWPTRNDAFVQLAETTLGGPNSGPRVNEVIISEVSYEPVDPDGAGRLRSRDFEFVELYNHTASPVDVSGWQLSATDEFTIPDGTVIGPSETLVVTSFDPSRTSTLSVFVFTLGADPTTAIVGERMRSFLDDENGIVQLKRPGPAAADDPDFIPRVFADGLAFGRTAPWPESANGQGDALARVSAQSFGALPTSWVARTPSPGAVDFVVRHVGDSNEDGEFNQLDITTVLQGGKYNTGQPATFRDGDWNGDGLFNPLDLVAALQTGTYLQGPFAAYSELVDAMLQRLDD